MGHLLAIAECFTCIIYFILYNNYIITSLTKSNDVSWCNLYLISRDQCFLLWVLVTFYIFFSGVLPMILIKKYFLSTCYVQRKYCITACWKFKYEYAQKRLHVIKNVREWIIAWWGKEEKQKNSPECEWNAETSPPAEFRSHRDGTVHLRFSSQR